MSWFEEATSFRSPWSYSLTTPYYSSFHRPSLIINTTPAVLSLICQHLNAIDLLRFLRSCSTLRRLNGTDSFRSVAWSCATLNLPLDRSLAEWALPNDSCFLFEGILYIPLTSWQQAMPVMRSTAEQWWKKVSGDDGWTERKLKAARLQELSEYQHPPTTTMLRSEGVNRVGCRVLSDVTWHTLHRTLRMRPPCLRSRFVLTATPHLQHLTLSINDATVDIPSAADIFSLVPHLRSLHLDYSKRQLGNFNTALSVRDVLLALPRLTSLHCTRCLITAQTFIDMAAHATLERIVINKCVSDAFRGEGENSLEWSDEATDSLVDKREKETGTLGENESDDESEDGSDQPEETSSDHTWLSVAMTRVVPTLSSIRARLKLADYLHGALKGARNPQWSGRQVRWVRSLLRSQLTAATVSADDTHNKDADYGGEWKGESAMKRGSKRPYSAVTEQV